MTDVVDIATRSRMMAGIGPKHTRPELAVRRYLHAAGLRFRLHAPDLPGRPDLVFARARVAVFVNGCFWHRHPGCRFATTPSTRVEFWRDKFERNVERDRRNAAQLKRRGWTVVTIWECEARNEVALDHLFWVVRAAEAMSDQSESVTT